MKTPTKEKPEIIEVSIKTKRELKEWQATQEWFNQLDTSFPVSVAVNDSLAVISICAWLTPNQHADIFYSNVEALEETGVADRLHKYICDPKKIYNNPDGTDGNR